MFPRYLIVLTAVYFLATLAHFAHNAEYIALYPGMPTWLTRETVYLAWLGVTGIGVIALVLHRLRARTAAVLFLGIYGAFGLDGLLHYTLGLCSEHTLAANLTIWTEASAGLVLLLCSALLLGRRPVGATGAIRAGRSSS